MITENRKAQILRLTESNGSISVKELMTVLDASESTIRRDLADLDQRGLLHKVHGGAVAIQNQYLSEESSVAVRSDLNTDAKLLIGAYAASLIRDNDIVFLDAGTTTGAIVPYLAPSLRTMFVTNGIDIAQKLLSCGFQVYMPSGRIKRVTQALIGADTCAYLHKLHFTKGFFGTNGLTIKEGFTTPDSDEAMVKEAAFSHCKERYILSDSSKFGNICACTFADFPNGTVITDDKITDRYRKCENILIAK